MIVFIDTNTEQEVDQDDHTKPTITTFIKDCNLVSIIAEIRQEGVTQRDEKR